MDKLKEYFEQHRAEMDVDSPPPNIWDRIELMTVEVSPVRKRVKLATWYAVAACILLLFGIGEWFNTSVKKDTLLSQKNNQVSAPETIMNNDDSAFSDKVTMVDKSYTHLINAQLKVLRASAAFTEDPGYFSVFVERLKQMDKDELGIKNDMRTYGLTDILLEQLINVYQQKLRVLKRLQKEINKMNNKTRV